MSPYNDDDDDSWTSEVISLYDDEDLSWSGKVISPNDDDEVWPISWCPHEDLVSTIIHGTADIHRDSSFLSFTFYAIFPSLVTS